MNVEAKAQNPPQKTSTALDWQTLLTRERLGKPVYSSDELGRSPFHKDHDRIIFSGAFRRLGRKTQVHPVSSNDHIHTRLTHSLEVGCVGRSLGMRVGEMLRDELPAWCAPSDLGVIVQSACLAHDIGNPPFGHSGEDAIRHWFRQAAGRGWLDDMSEAERGDFLSFEGNAQGFRVLTQLEYHQFDGGMRLTYATLGSYLKYPWTARHAEALGYKKHKFGCYQNELPRLEQIAAKLGLPKLDEQRWARHPLVYLMEAADDICYALIDLEDGVEMELLDYAEVEALLFDLVGDDLPQTYRQLGPNESRRRKLAILRGKAIEHLTNAAAHAFVEQAAHSGGFWMSLQELTATAPWLCKRMARLPSPPMAVPRRHLLAWPVAAALLHTKTWFELAPKAANIIVKDEKMGPEPIIKSLWAVTVVATIVILFVALYW